LRQHARLRLLRNRRAHRNQSNEALGQMSAQILLTGTAQPLNAFFFAPAMSLHGAGAGGGKLANLFSTHPSLERRLAELDKIQQQLGGISGTSLDK